MMSYDPYKEMQEFYRTDDPTEEQQFRFVEAMKYLIDTAYLEDDIIAFSYNLAMYYRDIREFDLEKKYLEIGAKYTKNYFNEELGFIWYYGFCGEQDFEKAYRYFESSNTRRAKYMIADMYHDGHYLKQDRKKCRKIIDDLFKAVLSERNNPRFKLSTLFPEIALRHVKLEIEAKSDTEFDFDCLLDAREILTVRQQHRPFWGNLRVMREIIEITVFMCGGETTDFIDLYDLMTLDSDSARITFDYDDKIYALDIFQNEGETVYQFEDKWYHGCDDFLEKGRIEGRRITSVIDLCLDITVEK